MDELEKKLLSRITELKKMREQANRQLMAINTTIAEMENLLKEEVDEAKQE